MVFLHLVMADPHVHSWGLVPNMKLANIWVSAAFCSHSVVVLWGKVFLWPWQHFRLLVKWKHSLYCN